MDITITIPNDKAQRVYDAFNAKIGHDAPNPTNQDKIDFYKSCLITYTKQTVLNYERQKAAEAASTAIETDDTLAS